jgi:RNA ligase (TIGR02306 family)
MGIDTHKVEIVPVVLEPHPNADRLSIVRVYNFTCVVNTADWTGVGKAAYVQPDSVMPDTPEYRFLKETGNTKKEREHIIGVKFEQVWDEWIPVTEEERQKRLAALEAKIDANTKRLRITVQKFRGVLSMGMLLPAPEGSQIGDDVAEKLGVTHYEPPTIDEIEGNRRHTGADVAPAPPMIYAPKYDVESVYKYADCFDKGELVYVTEKLDGQNARFVACRNEELGADESHIVELHAGSRTEWKKKEGGSNWWRVIAQNPWIEEWCYANVGRVLYGETYGWVQNLKYGAKQGQLFFRAFDVMDGMEYMNVDQFMTSVPDEARRVPSFGVMPFDFEALQALADGLSTVPNAGNIREGIVVKPLVERKHWKLGRVMVKMVSNAYLEKSAR